jgi:hypothetical protein
MLAAEPEQADAMALRALMSPNVYQSLAMEILQVHNMLMMVIICD